MKYFGKPLGLWLIFEKSFKENLITVFNYDEKTAKDIMTKAKIKYKEIIDKLPEFEKSDHYLTNIVSCAQLVSIILSMPDRPELDKLTKYYHDSMMIPIVKKAYKIAGKSKFTSKDIDAMKHTEKLRAADRNPYSWNMEFYPYKDGSGYEARFTKCGICALMKEYGLYDLVPAMCKLDYATTDAMGADFIREHTIASGGDYCDCGYKKRK